jgi:uncharacterized protein with FMN-binding domain
MKKIQLSAFVVVSFILYSLIEQFGRSSFSHVAPTLDIPLVTQSPSPSPSLNTSSSTKGYQDGQFTGNVADAFYGNVQVKTTIKNGQIIDVTFLDYPQDRHTSLEINRQAIPILSQEAIVAQSSNVDIVSGATATSQAFIQSLQSALSQAKI